MAGSTPVPFEGVSVLFYFSGNGYSSVRIVHLTSEHFGIIRNICGKQYYRPPRDSCGNSRLVVRLLVRLVVLKHMWKEENGLLW